MIARVLCAWTLIAAVSARIYERCELARDLSRLGIERERLATWVCIAFHESRLDTAAQNHGSGDHGLLQISELYWCGDGKACGRQCADFRDDDITDDVQCALQIHEEHTRLQGDGFLAWVVYPLHCNGNVKKYLAGCDKQETSQKSTSIPLKSLVRFSYNSHIDELKPPYLTINSIHSNYYKKSNDTQRYHYKIDNIDELRLPIFKKLSTTKPTFKSLEISTTTNNMLNKAPGVIYKDFPNWLKFNNLPKYVPKVDVPSEKHYQEHEIHYEIAKQDSIREFEDTKQNSLGASPVDSTVHLNTVKSNILPDNNVDTSTIRSIYDEKSTRATVSAAAETDIFEFYLTTRKPVLSTYSFAPIAGRHYKVNIFSDGTTPMPPFLSKFPSGGATRNHFKRYSPLEN